MSTNPYNDLSAAQLREAADLRDQIEAMEARLRSLLSGFASSASSSPRAAPAAPKKARKSTKKAGRKATKGKRVMSAEARERIRQAQTKRWAKLRADKAAAEAPQPAASQPRKNAAKKKTASTGKPKRKMSEEGRARIRAAVQARWDRERAAKAAAAGAPAKKRPGRPRTRT